MTEEKENSFGSTTSDSDTYRLSEDPVGMGPKPSTGGPIPAGNWSGNSTSPPFGGVPYGAYRYGYAPQEPPRRRGPGFLARCFYSCLFCILAAFFVLFLCACCLSGIVTVFESLESVDMPVTEKTLTGDDLSPDKVVILPIEGIIRGEEEGFVRKSIRQIQNDERVRALVLRVNSPGGTMTGSDYYHYLLKELKKERNIPVIVSMGAMATSGGYYISMVADKIYAERTTMTGSIGVIMPLYNGADLCKKIGFGSNSITSGPMKGMGDFTKPMADEERKVWQSLVDSSYEQFLSVVREGRPVFGGGKKAEVAKADPNLAVPEVKNESNATDKDAKKDDAKTPVTVKANIEKSVASKIQKKTDTELRKIADGRVYTAQEALDLGLIDEIGFLDSAVMEAMRMAHLDESKVQVVRYRSSSGLAGILGETEDMAHSNNVSNILSELTTPQAYYICPGMLPLAQEKK